MTTNRITGIIWVGLPYDRGGYGTVTRNYVLGLRKIGVPVRLVNVGWKHDGLDRETLRILTELEKADAGSYPIGVINYTPDFYRKVKFRNVVKTVGCTIYETDRIPKSWVGPLNAMDEVWVPTEFNRQTFSRSGVSSQKIRVIPYAVDTDFYMPISETLPVPGKKGFTFLYAFAFGWRKGFDLLLEAYYKEFTEADDVTLILKIYGWGNEQESIRDVVLGSVRDRVHLTTTRSPALVILDSSISQNDMRCLYNSCDLYVSTERAAGWGMTCMEAMAMGKPAAAISWGGSAAFMHSANSLLINPEDTLVPVDERLSSVLPAMFAGHRWPAVRVDEVRRVLRYAYAHRDQLQTIAKRGMDDVRSQYSQAVVARHIQEIMAEEFPPKRTWPARLLRRPGVRVSGSVWRRWRDWKKRMQSRMSRR
ncbi:MAG TPA: glycosyltransferase family 4 protein [Nitrospirota bacterium]